MKKVFLYPIWLRFWHWFNALLFLVLIVSGISLHYADNSSSYLTFEGSMLSHNISGILLSLNYLLFVIFSLFTGNTKHYIPKMKGLAKRIYLQVRFYALGIFLNEFHPFHTTKDNKFNPIQQLTYFAIMYVFMPIIVVSGWLMMFPELAPEQMFGMGGVWPMAFAHTIVGFLLSIFMLTHIYLGTTGNTVFELFKSMFTGWHLEHEIEKDVLETVPERAHISPMKRIKQIFPIIFYNPVTLIGALLSIISFILVLLLMLIEFFANESHPYLGIITFIILPSFLLFGLLLIAWGAIKENRRLLSLTDKSRKLPVIDLNNPKHQIAVLVFSVGTILILVFSVFGSFKAYEYTDSDEFCGQVCHKVMAPEFTAYNDSPHSKVGCVKCHIGSGAGWFVRSKLSGAYQVYSVLFNKYSKPIPTPVEALRPAPQTCEQCHWPKHFHSDNKHTKKYFLPNKTNDEFDLSFLVKIGGGSDKYEKSEGIHYVMNISNDISYLPIDEKRNIIPWIKTVSRIDGTERVYRDTSIKFDESLLRTSKVRKMDCIDCHNRPSHIYEEPHSRINQLLAKGFIDKDLPYIKRIAIQALETYTFSRETAFNDINTYIRDFYTRNYNDLYSKKKNELKEAIDAIYRVYMRNYFPSMNVDWKKYPNNLGHMYSPGCFRCHDGKHVSNDGRVIPNDCNVCHLITYQKLPGQEARESVNGLKFEHPGGVNKISDTKSCIQCHGAFPNKKDVLNY